MRSTKFLDRLQACGLQKLSLGTANGSQTVCIQIFPIEVFVKMTNDGMPSLFLAIRRKWFLINYAIRREQVGHGKALATSFLAVGII